MPLQLNDRVKETTSTIGTVPIVLNGASVGYQSIASSISTSNTFPYVIEVAGGSDWEIGIGTYVSGNNSIIRNQILNSSNTGNIVNFLSGTKNVFITVPAAYTALTAKGLSQFAATTSAELFSIISDETGSGKLVFSNNAILVTPDIGRANGTTLNLSSDLTVSGNIFVTSNVLVANLNADLLDGQHGTYYTGIGTAAFGQANAAYTQANTANTLATNTLVLAQTKVTAFYQNTSPTTSNTKDTWIHSDTGVKYENFGNTSSPVWVECGPSGIANNAIPGLVSGTSVLSSNGVYSTGTYQGSYTDGIVLDYVDGNGRISVGANDGITLYTSGTGNLALVSISNTGSVTANGRLITNYVGNTDSSVVIAGYNTRGGVGYHDFLRVTNGYSSNTTPNKHFRLNSVGTIEVLSSDYSRALLTLDDNGNLLSSGNTTINGISPGYAPNRPAFRVVGNNAVSPIITTTNGNGVLTGNNFTVDYNQGNYLNTANGYFIAPVAGLYSVNLIARTASNAYAGTTAVCVQKNSTTAVAYLEWYNNTSVNHIGGGTIVKLAVGDTLRLIVTIGQLTFDLNDNWSVAYIG